MDERLKNAFAILIVLIDKDVEIIAGAIRTHWHVETSYTGN
ncbi:hypothetical protein [Thalassotalea sp. ND16A]|nr:hypothetical protein [Thalassotalea sp. ND16A]